MTRDEFLREMSGDVPYSDRKVKGTTERNAEATALVLATFALVPQYGTDSNQVVS